MWRSVFSLLRSDDGAVAPTVALSLVGLIAAGGIAFDYARLESLDTELQDAADQAALAAASQLDGQTGACARAGAAASSLLTNKTYFANESGSTRDIVVDNETDCDATGKIRFYQSYDRATDTPGDPADSDANAKVVIVSVNPRQAFYAFTPIVAAFSSGDKNAEAVASLGSAICKMPPLMICNPAETAANTSFDPSTYIGKGLRLTSVGNGNGSWVPGNFGYLNTGGGSGGAQGLREAIGWNTPPGDCIATTGVDTKPGANVAVTDALNTRFDIYDSNASCPGGGSCSASINSLKDVRRPANASGNNSCKLHNAGWQLDTSGNGYYGNTAKNIPSSGTTALPATTTPTAMGHPRDMCHAISNAGSCTNGRIGDGKWDRDAYFRTNYVRSSGAAAGTAWNSADWQANTGLSPTAAVTAPNYASRYNVYTWEIANRGVVKDGVTVLGPRSPTATGSSLKSYGQPVCSAGGGLVPAATTPDRRRISVAVVNCGANNVHGNSTDVPVEKWIEVFLVEPSLQRDRTNAGDIYVEVIGETVAGGSGATAGQVIRHDVPYLIK
jgi:Flp pilus assembly protein TadG